MSIVWLKRSALACVMACVVSAASASARVKTISIVIDQMAFSAAGVVKVGEVVEWTNNDVVDHTATARNGAWRIVIPARKKARLVMKKAGTFDYYCEYHPNMTSRIVVASKRESESPNR